MIHLKRIFSRLCNPLNELTKGKSDTNNKVVNNLHNCYKNLSVKLIAANKILNRPLTLTEKILFCHLKNPKVLCENKLSLKPDHIALHDYDALLAMQQFMTLKLPGVMTSSSLHYEKMIDGKFSGDTYDSKRPTDYDKEIFGFLAFTAKKFGLDFCNNDYGSVHQTLYEKYVYPGMFMLSSDFYVAYCGGLAALCINTNSSKAIDIMSGFPFIIKYPHIIGVKVTGTLNKFVSPGDIFAEVSETLKMNPNETNVIEYFGSGINEIPSSWLAKICQLGADKGAAASIFPFTEHMHSSLIDSGHYFIAQEAKKYSKLLLRADEGASYHSNIDIDLGSIEPHIFIPFNPSVNFSLSKFGHIIKSIGLPTSIKGGLIGSCSTLTFEDMYRCASLAEHSLLQGMKAKVPLTIIPASQSLKHTMEKEGLAQTLRTFGAKCPSDASESCIETDIILQKSRLKPEAIITSCNLKSLAENNISPEHNVFIMSPEMVTAFSVTGTLDSNPTTLLAQDVFKTNLRLLKCNQRNRVTVDTIDDINIPVKEPLIIGENNKWLKIISSFPSAKPIDFSNLIIFMKIRGDCETKHISPKYGWLKYYGHMDKLCNNLLILALNDENGCRNKVRNRVTGQWNTAALNAKQYKSIHKNWVLISEGIFGAGDPTEVIGIQLRHMGCRAVLARSFPTEIEINLKRNGVLPLTFDQKRVFEKIHPLDLLTVLEVDKIMPQQMVTLSIKHINGDTDFVSLNHSLNEEEIKWLKAGSALNYIRQCHNKAKESLLANTVNEIPPNLYSAYQNSKKQNDTIS